MPQPPGFQALRLVLRSVLSQHLIFFPCEIWDHLRDLQGPFLLLMVYGTQKGHGDGGDSHRARGFLHVFPLNRHKCLANSIEQMWKLRFVQGRNSLVQSNNLKVAEAGSEPRSLRLQGQDGFSVSGLLISTTGPFDLLDPVAQNPPLSPALGLPVLCHCERVPWRGPS